MCFSSVLYYFIDIKALSDKYIITVITASSAKIKKATNLLSKVFFFKLNEYIQNAFVLNTNKYVHCSQQLRNSSSFV